MACNMSTEKFHSSIERRGSDGTTETESCNIKEREGGRVAWLTVVGSILVYYCSAGLVNSFGFFQAYYTRDFLDGTQTSTIAFIGTLQICLVNVLAAVSGTLCDFYGVKWLYTFAGCGTVISMLILSFLKENQFWPVFIIQGLFMGLAVAFGVQPALTAAGQHFPKKRALAMGLVTAGSAMGGIVFPLMFERLLPTLGYSWTLRIVALKIAIFYVIALWISTSLGNGKKITDNWGSLLDYRGFLDARYSVLCVGAFLAQLGQWTPSYYIKMYSNAAYPNNAMGDYFLPVMNGCSIIGALVGSCTGDILGRLNLLWPMVLITGCLCVFVWLFNTSLAMLILFACLFGFSTGKFAALIPSAIGQVTPDEKLGARMGSFYSIVAIASLVGTPISSALITDNNERDGYSRLICFAGGALIAGSMSIFASRLLCDMDLRKRW